MDPTQDRPPLDESARRRPDFTPGIPIRLANGQEWSFPEPTLSHRLHLDDEGRPILLAHEKALGRAYGEALDRLLDVSSVGEYQLLVSGLALMLLGRNYDLRREDVPELFAFTPGDPESEATFQALERLVVGQAPKPSAAG